MTTFKDRFGYKGIETSLNGLTSWLQENLQLSGKLHDRYLNTLRIVVQYGLKEIPEFKPRGHLTSKAEYVAKNIQRENKFQHFVNWVRKNYDEYGNLKSTPTTSHTSSTP